MDGWLDRYVVGHLVSTPSLEDLLNEKEWRKCAPEWESATLDEKVAAFRYFCATYVKIRHPKKGQVLFELRDAQEETVRLWLEHRYTVALKARQIGFSTLVSIFCFWLTFFYGNRTVIMLSKGEREAQKLLTHAKYAYRFLPKWLKYRGPETSSNQSQMAFTNESIIESLPSAADPARGATAFAIVVDEVGQLPNSEDAWAAIEPVADVGGQVIMLGTANGEGNLLHRIWVGAKGWWRDRDGEIRYEGSGINRFRSIFHGWWTGGRNDDWYEQKKRDLPDWQLAQEYPSNPDEAFLRSGRPVFNVDRLREIEVVEPIARGHLRKHEGEFAEDGGPLRIWQFPEERHVYAIGCDVAEGLEHGDFSSVHVIDARTLDVVAHWHGHVDPDVLGEDILPALGWYYNRALIGVESNNHGLTTLKGLVRAEYPAVYRQRRQDRRNAAPTEALGWRTTSATKPLAIDELGKELREGTLGLQCGETLAELRTFVRDGSGKMNGSPHDDRVMSLAIAVQMLKYVWLPQYRPQEKPGPGTIGYMLEYLESKENGKRKDPPIGAFGVRAA